MTKRILLLFAHPSPHRSEVNAPMFDLAKSLSFVTAVDLYAQYPRFNIDIDLEQQRLKSHDIVIFQFPFYWYSTPAMLKEWQDLVLEYNFAYGPDGDALKNKIFLCAISAGGKEQAYDPKGYNYFTVRELLQPLEQTARLTQMNYLPPFTLFSARSAKKNNTLNKHLQQWSALLHKLYNNEININNTANDITLNHSLTKLQTEVPE